MSAIHVLYLAYAVIVLLGGVMGFIKAYSVPSLAAGVVAAVLMFVALWLVGRGDGRAGLILGAAVSAVMDTFFMFRYLKTKKAMPAIPIAVLSVVVLVPLHGRIEV